MINFKPIVLSALLLLFIGCRNEAKKSQKVRDTISIDSTEKVDSVAQKSMQRPHKDNPGVGPIKHEVKLDDKINDSLATAGKKLYENKCSECHRLHRSATGPALAGVLEERSPQFVMNMILAPDEMIKRNAEVKAMKGQYQSEMINLHLSKEEARQIVEYIRTL